LPLVVLVWFVWIAFVWAAWSLGLVQAQLQLFQLGLLQSSLPLPSVSLAQTALVSCAPPFEGALYQVSLGQRNVASIANLHWVFNGFDAVMAVFIH